VSAVASILLMSAPASAPAAAEAPTWAARSVALPATRAVAPAQRGYWPGGAAPDGSYRISSTSQDVLALIEALGREQAGHRWR
jgi:pimeloyl-ACP methyl ester carboxylesterase